MEKVSDEPLKIIILQKLLKQIKNYEEKQLIGYKYTFDIEL